ncbi:MAG: serine/threonine protein kinase [Archangiaceae bacterium]|nr:serine/threonine protein kinase [Archangiaceae bacterium]
MSGSDDFDGLYQRLGLDGLPADAAVDSTFVPETGDTVASKPRQRPPAAAALSGTLPRLQLSSPDAANLGEGTAELEPLQVLGEGGMGRVLLARQSSLGREVAVKVLRQDTQAAAEGLIHEARTTGGLEHPSVVPIYALARDSHGAPALVMRRVDGVSWRELLHQSDHPAWEKLAGTRDRLGFHIEVLIQVCNAVAHAHRRGVLHRDVKPANVLLGELGEVYLADWGVALKRVDAANEPLRLVGTPAYLAPEMVPGDARQMDERTDVYLLGGTLHEVLTGEPPHLGSNLREVMQLAWQAAPPSLAPGVPPLLAAACARALAKNPADRFASATALRDELQRFLQHRGASELAAVAARRLAELETMHGSSDSAGLRRFFTVVSECRFGFTQALQSSPGHPEARDGLVRCLTVAARHELARGAAASAAAFLSELEAPPAELTRTLEQLQHQDAEKARAQEEMKKLSHELDLDVSRSQRTWLVVAMGGFISAMVGALVVTGQQYLVDEQRGGWGRMVPLGLSTAVFAGVALFWRRALFSTRINRQLMGLISVALAGALAQRAFSVLLKLELSAALAHDALLFTALSLFAGVVMHRGFLVTAAVFGASAVSCLLWPSQATAIFGFTSALGIVSTALVLRRWQFDRLPRGR